MKTYYRYGLLALILLGTCLTFGRFLILQDFSIYLRATQEFIAGANPYQLPDHYSYLRGDFGSVAGSSTKPLQVWGPPFVFTYFMPLALLELGIAKGIFLVVITGAYILSAYISSSKPGAAKLAIPSLLAYLLLILPYFVTTVLWGGISVLPLAGLLGFLFFNRLDRPFISGIWFSLLCIKIHVYFGIVGIFLLHSLQLKRYRAMGGLLTGLTSAVLISWASQPNSWGLYFTADRNTLTEYLYKTDAVWTFAYAGVSYVFQTPYFYYYWFAFFSVLLLIRSYSSNKSADLETSIMRNLPLCLLLTPYAWTHDFIVLAPAVSIGCYLRQTNAHRDDKKQGQFCNELLLIIIAIVSDSLFLLTYKSPLTYIHFIVLMLLIEFAFYLKTQRSHAS